MKAAVHVTNPTIAVNRQSSIPAWALSLGMHCGLLMALAFAWRSSTLALRDEPDRAGGIVLVQQNASQETTYYQEPSQAETDAESTSRDQSTDREMENESAPIEALPDQAAAALLQSGTVALPQPGDLPSALVGVVQSPTLTSASRTRLPTGTDVAAILAEDAARMAARQPKGTPTQVSLFGSPAVAGRSFAFLIDRSTSMGGQGLGALEAAEQHLLAALENLSDEHEFQIVVYNERPHYFDERSLRPATAENKANVAEYLRNVAASGKTDHDLALHSVLRMQPDVIFLLTDGGDPHLTDPQMRVLQRLAAGRTSIHCIQFGFGPLQGDESFPRRLARTCGGTFTYVDMRGP